MTHSNSKRNDQNMTLPKLRFAKNQKVLEATSGSNLMKCLLDNNIPVASSCGGDGVCGKCQIQVVEGMQNLNQENETELFLRERYKTSKETRFACQCEIQGDLVLDAKYW